MTERKQYTEDQLEKIAEALWGTGRFRHGTSLYDVLCPICGSDTQVRVSSIIRPPPPRFRAICSTCEIDSSGEATSVAKRPLTEEEMVGILELHVRGQCTTCPACLSPLQVEDLNISGSGSRDFKITCLRYDTQGQKSWPPVREKRT